MTHMLSPSTPAMPKPPPPPPPFGAIQGQKPQRKAMAPTFLGTGVTPGSMVSGAASLASGGQFGKTLLGQ